jgi:hypothetical protein
MPQPVVRKADVWQGADVTFRERLVTGNGGTALTSLDVNSWSLRVFRAGDEKNAKRIVTDASPTSYFFDTLQLTDWTRDTVGYNFQYRLPYSSFKASAATYVFEFAIKTSTYGTIFSVWEIRYLPVGSV